MSVLTIIPSRGRPQAAQQFIESFHDTVGDPNSMLVFAVDYDDPTCNEYVSHSLDVIVTTGVRKRMGPTLNEHALAWAKTGQYDVIGFAGDDHRMRTPGWDIRVAAALESSPGIAYGNDLVHGPNLPTAAWVSASIIRDLGYIAPLTLTHMYLDSFWLQLGNATNLHYLPDLVFEHLHPIVNKAEWDAGYAEVNGFMEPDRIEYERYMREDFRFEMRKITQ